MTPIQKKVFQILQIFTQICDQLQLKYFLVCGSALGAVKYGGFVPWDDDVDVALFRNDYERFCKEAPALLPEQLFLQNFQSDPAFPAIYSKLRNSERPALRKASRHFQSTMESALTFSPWMVTRQIKRAGTTGTQESLVCQKAIHSLRSS